MSQYVNNSARSLLAIFILSVGFLNGCASIEVKPVAFKAPTQYQNHFTHSGFSIAFVPIVDEATSREHFNVDFVRTSVMPVRVIIQNRGNREILLDAKQVFGVTTEGDFYQSYDLDQSTRIIRQSEIGASMATGAAVGVIAGAALGAAVGAGIGHAAGGSGDIGRGAGAGAIIGGTAGGVGGVAAGVDTIAQQVRREMRRANWGAQVVYPGEMKNGYIFFPNAAFKEIAFNLYDLIDRNPIPAALPFGGR